MKVNVTLTRLFLAEAKAAGLGVVVRYREGSVLVILYGLELTASPSYKRIMLEGDSLDAIR